MRKKADREAQDRALANGWIIEGADQHTVDTASSAIKMQALDQSEATAEQNLAEINNEARLETANKQQLSNGMLVVFGVVGGLYLLYAWVWMSWASSYAAANTLGTATAGSIDGFLQQTMYWAVPVAPVLWFLAVLWVLRGSTPKKIAFWLLLGLIVLVPLPMFDLGVAA